MTQARIVTTDISTLLCAHPGAALGALGMLAGRIMIGMNRQSYVHFKVMDFITEPVGNPEDLTAPIERCCQYNLSAETVLRLENSDLMTT